MSSPNDTEPNTVLLPPEEFAHLVALLRDQAKRMLDHDRWDDAAKLADALIALNRVMADIQGPPAPPGTVAVGPPLKAFQLYSVRTRPEPGDPAVPMPATVTGVTDYTAPLTAFERRAGVIPISRTAGDTPEGEHPDGGSSWCIRSEPHECAEGTEYCERCRGYRDTAHNLSGCAVGECQCTHSRATFLNR